MHTYSQEKGLHELQLLEREEQYMQKVCGQPSCHIHFREGKTDKQRTSASEGSRSEMKLLYYETGAVVRLYCQRSSPLSLAE